MATKKELAKLWAEKFDKIYCLHHLPYRERGEKVKAEFDRVGILGSGVFEWYYTVPNPFEQKYIADNPNAPRLGTTDEINRPYWNILLAQYNLLKEASLQGFERILFLEDDVRFVSDLGHLKKILKELPVADSILLSYCTGVGNSEEGLKSLNDYKEAHTFSENKDYFKVNPKEWWFANSDCVALSRVGIDSCLENMEKTTKNLDSVFTSTPVSVALKEQVAIQESDTYSVHNYYTDQVKGYEVTGVDLTRFNHEYKEKKLKISVYAIAKNEAQFVDRWVDSMQEADEIVVLDTGSTDDTVEKLKSRGVKVETKVYDPWRFDVPRNDSMKLVSEDTDILVCTDLDEILLPGWRDKLERAWRKALDEGKKPTTACYEYVWNFEPDGSDGRKFTYEKVHAPNTCKWTHPVHEVLSYGVPREAIYVNGMRLEHHADPAKSRGSYLPLLEMSVEEDPEDDRNMHYLGREYMFYGKWDKAIETLKRHLKMPRATWKTERAASMRFIARCYNNKGEDELAEYWFMKACDEDPYIREPAIEYAQFLYHREDKDWNAIAKACKRVLSVKERLGSYLTEPEAWGSLPHDLYACALWGLNDYAGALQQELIACKLDPKNERLKGNLASMLRTVKAMRDEYIKKHPEMAEKVKQSLPKAQMDPDLLKLLE